MYEPHASKIKNLYLTNDYIKLPIHTISLRNNTLHDSTLIKLTVTCSVGAGGFLIRCTVTRIKHTANEIRSAMISNKTLFR